MLVMQLSSVMAMMMRALRSGCRACLQLMVGAAAGQIGCGGAIIGSITSGIIHAGKRLKVVRPIG